MIDYNILFSAIGLAFALIATIFLYFGSKETPWEIRTWDGKGEDEKKFLKKRQVLSQIGFILLGVGFFVSVYRAILSELN